MVVDACSRVDGGRIGVTGSRSVCLCERVVVVLCEHELRLEEITREDYARSAGDWWRLVRRDACVERLGGRLGRDVGQGNVGEIGRVDWAGRLRE